MGLGTPIIFTADGLYGKHVTNPKYGMDATTMSFGAAFLKGVVVMTLGISWYWQKVEAIDWNLFGIGIAGSALDTLGKMCIYNAFSTGSAGVIGAYL